MANKYAKSLSEFRRLTAQGADVKPPTFAPHARAGGPPTQLSSPDYQIPRVPVFTAAELDSAAANVSSIRLKHMLRQAAARARVLDTFRSIYPGTVELESLENLLAGEGLA